jgi:hypothetical protein
MSCRSCQSDRQTRFPSELSVHFPGGLQALDKGQVMIFPELLVCLNCGFTEFSVPEEELRRLAQDAHGSVADARTRKSSQEL